MKWNLKVLMLAATLGLLGCKSMSVYESSWFQQELNRDNYQAGNSTYQLSWNVYNDKDYLYIDLRSGHRPTILKMLRAGFTVYIDGGGKKSEERYVQYPVKRKPPMERSAGNRGNRNSGAQRGGMDLIKMLQNVSEEVVLKSMDGLKQTTTDKLVEYQFNLTSEAEGVLNYALRIPLKDMLQAPVSSEISVGLVSGSFEMPQRPSGSGQGGGRPGGGGRPQGMGGNAQMSSQMAEMTDPIKIWFKTVLAEDNE